MNKVMLTTDDLRDVLSKLDNGIVLFSGVNENDMKVLKIDPIEQTIYVDKGHARISERSLQEGEKAVCETIGVYNRTLPTVESET